jgi:tripartite-type tricarboxylate transporter receptor subunit TctC
VAWRLGSKGRTATSRKDINMKVRTYLLCALYVLAFAFPSSAGAQNWPNRPIRFVVSQAAGGTPDILCRLVTERIGRALGQQIIVENRPGGANVVGAQAAARAAPDEVIE